MILRCEPTVWIVTFGRIFSYHRYSLIPAGKLQVAFETEMKKYARAKSQVIV